MAAWRRLTRIRHLSGPPRRTVNWSAAGAELADPATLRGRQDQLAAEPDGARSTCENSRTVSLLMAGILAPPYFHTFTAGVVPYLHYTICVNCLRRRHRTLLTGASRSLARAGRGAGHAGLARRPVPWAFVDLHRDFGVPVDRLAISPERSEHWRSDMSSSCFIRYDQLGRKAWNARTAAEEARWRTLCTFVSRAWPARWRADGMPGARPAPPPARQAPVSARTCHPDQRCDDGGRRACRDRPGSRSCRAVGTASRGRRLSLPLDGGVCRPPGPRCARRAPHGSRRQQ